MDEQELQRLLQQAMEEIRTLGAVSKETADKIEEAGDEYGHLKKTLKAHGEQFARTMVGITRTVGEGNTEFTVFNSVVDSVTGALTEMGKSIPFFGAAMVAAGEGAKFLLGQLQATTKAFNQVGAAGLAGAEGMSGLRDQFQTAGIDLQTYTKVITGNSEALAAFGGTAADGAARFSKALGRVNQDFGTQLMNMGLSFDAIAEQTASYIAMQSRLGRAQNMTQAQLAKGAFEYAKELDALAKLTGQQKDQIVKQQDAALSESRFRAKYDEMVARGQVGQAKAMLDFQTRVNRFSPALAQGLRDISTGFVNTEAAQALFISTGGKAAQIMQQLQAGTINQEQAFAQLQAATQQSLPMQRSLAMAVGDVAGVFPPFAQASDLAKTSLAELGSVARTQAQQMAGTDGLTGSAVAAQKAMMNFSIAVNQLATQALPQAGTAVGAFANVMTKAVEAISKATNVKIQMPQQEYADGGIATGPKTGYAATLHGSEAVVPLPDGKTIPVEIKNANPFANTGLQASEGWAQSLAANQITRRSIQQELMSMFPRDITDSATAHAAMRRQSFLDNENIANAVLERMGQYFLPSFAGLNPYEGFKTAGMQVGDSRLAAKAGLIDPNTGLMPDASQNTAMAYIEQMLGYVKYDMGAAKVEMQKVGQDLEKMMAKITVPLGGGQEISHAELISVNDYGKMMQELPKILFDLKEAPKMAEGGITQGPSIAGEAGPEAVIPLANGRSISVDMPGLIDGIQELVSLMRAQNGISNKILQASTN